MSDSVLDRIRLLLESRALPFREVHHSPTNTSEESAKARGEDVAIGSKAILMKVGDEFKLFVLSAAKKIDSQKVKSKFGSKRRRFTSLEELQGFTGLVPGSLPPFGKPILPFDLFVDLSITANEKIAFNAGSLTTSIIMNCRDYLGLVSAEVFDFAT